eukprot:330707_1
MPTENKSNINIYLQKMFMSNWSRRFLVDSIIFEFDDHQASSSTNVFSSMVTHHRKIQLFQSQVQTIAFSNDAPKNTTIVPVAITKNAIKRKYVYTVEWYVRKKTIKVMSQDIVDLILFFYAK